MKRAVIDAVKKHKLIAILRGISDDNLIPLAEALYEGGIRLLEITYSADGSTPDRVIASNIKALCQHFEGKMYIGAGTVLTTKQVELTKEAGGLFIISPNVDDEVIAKTNQLELVSMPGGLTPSEVCHAHKAGADFVKLFPVSNLGPDYVKAIKAPISHISLLAVGGVDENNMASYLAAGVSGFGVGSNITNKKLIEANDWQGITKLAEKYVKVINA